MKMRGAARCLGNACGPASGHGLPAVHGVPSTGAPVPPSLLLLGPHWAARQPGDDTAARPGVWAAAGAPGPEASGVPVSLLSTPLTSGPDCCGRPAWRPGPGCNSCQESGGRRLWPGLSCSPPPSPCDPGTVCSAGEVLSSELLSPRDSRWMTVRSLLRRRLTARPKHSCTRGHTADLGSSHVSPRSGRPSLCAVPSQPTIPSANALFTQCKVVTEHRFPAGWLRAHDPGWPDQSSPYYSIFI